MEKIEFQRLEVQRPCCHNDLNHLNPGLVLGSFEDFTGNIPLVYTNQQGPGRLLMRYGNNQILRARLDGKDGSSLRFEENSLIAKGSSITPYSDQGCEMSRWIIENGIISKYLPGIKQKNKRL